MAEPAYAHNQTTEVMKAKKRCSKEHDFIVLRKEAKKGLRKFLQISSKSDFYVNKGRALRSIENLRNNMGLIEKLLRYTRSYGYKIEDDVYFPSPKEIISRLKEIIRKSRAINRLQVDRING